MQPFVPKLQDVKKTCAILARFHLPDELTLCILDYARYWIEVETNSKQHIVLVDEAWSLNYSVAYPYLFVPVYHWTDARAAQLKIREITFTIVSHDQGWTTEDTRGTYQTSSWFEISISRPRVALSSGRRQWQPGLRQLREMTVRGDTIDGICVASDIMHSSTFELIRRPTSVMEVQRAHCTEMMEVKTQGIKEGEHSWYLQGNKVAREKSVFEGDMVKRYSITWGCKDNPLQVTNEGAGSGDGFIDTLKRDDYVCVWARAKVSDCSVVQHNAIITRVKSATETRLGEPHLRGSNGHTIHDLTYVRQHHCPHVTAYVWQVFGLETSDVNDENFTFSNRNGSVGVSNQ